MTEDHIQSMKCPVCGKMATEYDLNKWQCLECGRKFIYEPPKQPDVYTKNENINKLDESSFFTCAICNGNFNRQTFAEYNCKACGNTICKDHFNKGRCKSCSDIYNVMVILILIFAVLFVLAIESCEVVTLNPFSGQWFKV